MLTIAARTNGPPYLAARDAIVNLGPSTLLALANVTTNQASSWQQRAMAGICIERINRGEELKSFQDIKRWREDAELKKDPTWRDRGGPYGISSVAAKRWLEAGLTNHLVQLAWKGEGEHPPMGHSWDLLAAKTLEKINYPYLVNIAREHVRAIKDPKDIAYGHVNWYFDYLLRVKDHDSLALVFDLWLKYRPIERAADYKLLLERKNTVEQSERGADAHVERWLALILPMATPADEGWITEKLKDIKLGGDGQRFLSEYQQRCRQ